MFKLLKENRSRDNQKAFAKKETTKALIFWGVRKVVNYSQNFVFREGSWNLPPAKIEGLMNLLNKTRTGMRKRKWSKSKFMPIKIFTTGML
jgi:hypothetical protein